jgi:hypothetical protein
MIAGAVLPDQREVGTRAPHALHLQELGEAEDGLQRVVQLVGDARDQDADGGEPLLPDDLLLSDRAPDG